MDLQYFKQYFKNNGANLNVSIRLYYCEGGLFGDEQINLYFRRNELLVSNDFEFGKISIETPCLPSEISKKRKFIDDLNSVEWNELGALIKEEFIKYLRQLHRVDGEMTKAAH